MNVQENIKTAIELLDENNEYYKQLIGENGLSSITDQKIDFWLHYIEFNDKIKLMQMYRIIKEIRRLRKERRKYKNDTALLKLFKDNEQKLVNNDHRKILLTQIYKTTNRQENAKYSYAAYSKEEAEKILGIKLIDKENE